MLEIAVFTGGLKLTITRSICGVRIELPLLAWITQKCLSDNFSNHYYLSIATKGGGNTKRLFKFSKKSHKYFFLLLKLLDYLSKNLCKINDFFSDNTYI